MPKTGRYRSSRASVAYPFPPVSGELEVALPAGARCGVCLTHDIDHLGLREHFVDGFLLRYLVFVLRRDLLAGLRPLRTLRVLAGAVAAPLGRDPWNVVDDLLEEEERHGVHATWFAAVRPGRGIAYRPEAIRPVVGRIAASGREVGLHGQSADDAGALAEEAATLGSWLERPPAGLRMHYLRLTPQVVEGMERAGLRYEASVMNREDLHPDRHPLDAPRRLTDRVLEVPLHVMDSTLFSPTGLALDAQEATGYLRRLLERAAETRRTITLNLHPNSFSHQSPDCRDWYRALLRELSERTDVFVTDMRGLVERVTAR
jgi:peptidoglycan/xylan/chitin deacetylase (PgdA/CDA1 family)